MGWPEKQVGVAGSRESPLHSGWQPPGFWKLQPTIRHVWQLKEYIEHRTGPPFVFSKVVCACATDSSASNAPTVAAELPVVAMTRRSDGKTTITPEQRRFNSALPTLRNCAATLRDFLECDVSFLSLKPAVKLAFNDDCAVRKGICDSGHTQRQSATQPHQ
jgi:hypothetical protein